MKHAMALCWAGYQGDLEELQRLVANGVNLDTADYDGRTCLHLAASEGHTNIVKFLIAKQSYLFPKDRWGSTPLDNATQQGFTEIIELLKPHKKIV